MTMNIADGVSSTYTHTRLEYIGNKVKKEIEKDLKGYSDDGEYIQVNILPYPDESNVFTARLTGKCDPNKTTSFTRMAMGNMYIKSVEERINE